MNDYEKLQTEARRLEILTVLAQDADYAANDAILQSALGMVGLAVSRDRLRTDLDWLAEQGLVGLDTPAGLYLARLTARGLDVALSRTVVPGVARRRPVI